jgi:hypothetical protein
MVPTPKRRKKKEFGFERLDLGECLSLVVDDGALAWKLSAQGLGKASALKSNHPTGNVEPAS